MWYGHKFYTKAKSQLDPKKNQHLLRIFFFLFGFSIKSNKSINKNCIAFAFIIEITKYDQNFFIHTLILFFFEYLLKFIVTFIRTF